MNYETLRLKFRNKIFIPFTWKQNRARLKQTSFTIISNNCWAGTIYESYGLQKMSPTIGMFIMPDDYIRFLRNLKQYLSESCSFNFIHANASKWKSILEGNINWGRYPIVMLDDIELHLLHYHGTFDEIKATWNRRLRRIDWNHLLVKFNDQNGCTSQHIANFFDLPYKNKLFFSSSKNKRLKSIYGRNFILINQPQKLDYVYASYEPFGSTRCCNVTDIINSLNYDNENYHLY